MDQTQQSELENLEQALRSHLGSEHDYLVGVVAAGFEADELIKGPHGKALLARCLSDLRRSLRALADPMQPSDEERAALHLFRVAHATLASLSSAIREGRIAEHEIEERLS